MVIEAAWGTLAASVRHSGLYFLNGTRLARVGSGVVD